MWIFYWRNESKECLWRLLGTLFARSMHRLVQGWLCQDRFKRSRNPRCLRHNDPRGTKKVIKSTENNFDFFFSVFGLYQESRQRFVHSSLARISRIEAGWPLGHLHFALAWSSKGRICSTVEIKGHKPKSPGIRGFGTFGRIWRQQILTKIKKNWHEKIW